jgi:hypothetical protein
MDRLIEPTQGKDGREKPVRWFPADRRTNRAQGEAQSADESTQRRRSKRCCRCTPQLTDVGTWHYALLGRQVALMPGIEQGADPPIGGLRNSVRSLSVTHIRHAYLVAVTAGAGRAIAKTYRVHHATVGHAERRSLIPDATDKPGRKVLRPQMRQR